MLVDALRQRLDRARQRVRPDAHHHRGRQPGARNRDHPVRQGHVHAERRLQRQRPSPTPSPTTARPTAPTTSSRTPPPSTSPSPRSTTRRRRSPTRRRVAEDGTLSFPASDLTANDSAGPANESGQTLTVISVDPITGQTHGSVSLVAGTVTYTPDADFNGLAKFDYTVQDNGTTNGARTSRPEPSRQRHRHRGQRRPDGQRRLEDRRRGRHALLPGERPDGQRLGRPGERKRPDADGHGCGSARRTALSRSSPARSPTRRTPTTTAPASFHYTVTRQRHDQRRRRSARGPGHRRRHRHRGQRRADGGRRLEDRRRGRHALLPGERPDANDSAGPRTRAARP